MQRYKLICVMLAVFTLVGCKGNITDFKDEDKSSRAQTVYLVGFNFESENPLLVKNEINRNLFSLIYDGLFEPDDSYRPVPRLAEGISVSSDGLSATVFIKEKVTFHDGTTLTSKDVSATINYLLTNSTYYDYNVRHIREVKSDSDSVTLYLKEPCPNIAALLTFPIVSAKDILGSFNMNGSGRFKVENYLKRKNISLVPYSNYYGENNPEIKEIFIQLLPDKQTAKYSYKSGLADVFSQDIFEQDESTTGQTNGSSRTYLSLNYSFLLLNNANPMFTRNVRKAIALAINKDDIVEDVLFSFGEKTATPVSPASYLSKGKTKTEYNPEKAKKLLEQEGYYPNVNTGIAEKTIDDTVIPLTFNILVNEDNSFRIQVANKISENLKSIGIEAKVTVVPFERYSEEYTNKTYEAFLGAVLMSPEFDLSPFMGDYNVSNYESDRAKEIINKIIRTDGEEEKIKEYEKLMELFCEDVPHISLYYTKATLRSSSKIKRGLSPTGYNIFYGIENWSFN